MNLHDHTLSSLRSLGVNPDTSLLVAVSGGLDSMSLLSVLISLHTRSEVGDITIFHLDHSLRAESNADAEFVEAHAKSLGIPCFVEKLDIAAIANESGKGIEDTARKERYRLLREISEDKQIPFIITAHHRDDLVETLLMRIARGTGVRGLAGIRPSRKLGSSRLLRPWLGVTRQEIADFASQSNIQYREDASNASLDYERNRVRHILLPALRTTFPNRDIASSLERLASNANETSHWLDAEASRLYAAMVSEGTMLREAFLELASPVAKLVIERMILENTRVRLILAAQEWQGVAATIANGQRAIQLRNGIELRVTSEELTAQRHPATARLPDAVLILGGESPFPTGILKSYISHTAPLVHDAKVAFFDYEQLQRGALFVRGPRLADRIRPFGMAGKSRLVRDILREAGIPVFARSQTPLLILRDATTGTEEILWVVGLRASEVHKVIESTTEVAVFEWLPLPETKG